MPPLSLSQDSIILWVWIYLNGSSTEKAKIICQINSSWANKLRSGHIRKYDIWLYLQSTVKNTAEYPLLSNTMTSNQCQCFESLVIQITLYYSVIFSGNQIYIVAGPACKLGIKNGFLYVTQGRKQINALKNFDRSKCVTGLHLRKSIERYKMDLGCAGTLLSNNFIDRGKCITQS